MQSLRTTVVSFQNFLAPTNVVSLNIQRTYVRNFWAKNNDYKGIPGIKRNPPKMYGYTYSKRNVSFIVNTTKKFADSFSYFQMVRDIHRPSEIKRIRVKGYDAMMSTPSGRIRMMKKYLEKSPFLAECI